MSCRCTKRISNIQGHFGTTRTAALNSAHLDHPLHSNSSAGMIIPLFARFYLSSPMGKTGRYRLDHYALCWVRSFALVLFCCLLIFIVRKCCFTVRHGTAPGNPLLALLFPIMHTAKTQITKR